ncbi:MAG: GNAT family N-acetyltransferase [Candidatus Lokiarchaeota archaeon]|nr:GNAT family N-acetyltransferase [Candidatus Lokiarchaeota archaeon]
MKDEIVIRKCKKEDWKGIMKVCYRTGYMGEDVEGHFGDKYLFGLFFCLYYPWYEWWNCFVAVRNNKIVGYILGTLNTEKQEKFFAIKMIWRILLRLVFVSWWRYPNILKVLVHLICQAPKALGNNGVLNQKDINDKFPAHLHIDILETYQRKGIGSKFINRFEDHLRKHGIKGVHLGTSSKNVKAIPFYKKNGYKIIKIGDSTLWPNTPDVKDLTFAKRL